ncbi:MAG TPA: membrane protease subunit, stomatin/prohibitin [Hyphomonadaceae bacterium]|nr:membrane protease subunit, stomatin/prohibitin [Hyphomonadaceae bacterium]
MPWSMFNFHQIVRDDERGLLTRNGRIEKLIEPGRFSAFDPGRQLAVEVMKVVRGELPVERALLIQRALPESARDIEIVQVGANEVAIVSLDGEPKHIVSPNTSRAFWKAITAVAVERIDTSTHLRVERRHLDKIDAAKTPAIASALIEPHETALLIVDGEVKERLGPGRHAFWAVARTVRIAKVDLRPTPLEVTAQEILTKDRVAIRVTLTAFFRVIDPEKAVLASADLANTIYRLVQFAIREAVATRTLDEILAARDSIDTEVRGFVSERVAALGAEIGEIGVKDVILPGDIRELLNKVVEAERVAKANLIRRQEETAATRSLLNTARLMEDNPLLLRLKELEALERLVEKVGRIDLHAGDGAGGLQALLSNLYRLSDAAPGKSKGE